MTLKANETGSQGPAAEVLDAANYSARVVQVIDLGLQTQRPYEGQQKPPANEIMVTYELGTEFMKGEDGEDLTDKPRWISERFSLFPLFSERAKSTKRYNVLDPNGVHKGDWSRLIGSACLVAVTTNVSKANGKTYNNVGAISLPMKGLVAPDLVGNAKTFDLGDPDQEVFETIPEWIQKIIQENLEYKGSLLEAILEGKPQAGSPSGTGDTSTPEIDDEAVPF